MRRFGLPLEIPEPLKPRQPSSAVADEDWIEALASDKKREKGKVNLVLLKRIGAPLHYPIAVGGLLDLIAALGVERVQAS
jgi:3-dehydroquinate synthetase